MLSLTCFRKNEMEASIASPGLAMLFTKILNNQAVVGPERIGENKGPKEAENLRANKLMQ